MSKIFIKPKDNTNPNVFVMKETGSFYLIKELKEAEKSSREYRIICATERRRQQNDKNSIAGSIENQ